MIRPIDTQTIYQQTPEVSNKQQAIQYSEEMKQVQFAEILQKETEIRQEIVTEVKENQKTDDDLNKKQKRQNDALVKNKKKKNKRKSDTIKEIDPIQHIDIKI